MNSIDTKGLSKEMLQTKHNGTAEELDRDMLQIQVNIDDMSPEGYSYILDRLFQAGARDAYIIPIIMKKGRPGNQLSILAKKSDLEAIEDIIFKETSSIGLRYVGITVHRLERETLTVETPWGKVDVKIGFLKGKVVNVAPEFEDCAKAAQEGKIPLKNVYDFVKKYVSINPDVEEIKE
jgi:hypothetical protein